MVILNLSKVERKAQGSLELESHSKPHTKAQLERPKMPAQLDNQLGTKGEIYRILI